MAKMKILDWIAFVLLVVGGLNWGLVAIGSKFELIQYLQFGWLIRTVYGLVGVASLYSIYSLIKLNK